MEASFFFRGRRFTGVDAYAVQSERHIWKPFRATESSETIDPTLPTSKSSFFGISSGSFISRPGTLWLF